MESWREELHVNELYHHGIAGQKWGVRRYQNLDGSVTAAGARRYYEGVGGKTNRWGLSLGQRDANGNTRYISKADQPGRHGGGGGGGSDSGSSASSSSGGEERTNSAEKRASQVARAQEIADQERADKEAWIQSLRERVQNRPGKKAEEEKSSKKGSGSKASSGVAMTPEQVEEALKKILGDDAVSEEPKQEQVEEPAKEEPVNEPSEPEEEEPDENNLSEDEEKELGGYMVDPVTDKVYRVDEETGDAYEVDPKTGKTMEGKHVNLQKSKLEGLVSAIRQGAENFREAFRNVVNSIRSAKASDEPSEDGRKAEVGDKEFDSRKAGVGDKEIDSSKMVSGKNAAKESKLIEVDTRKDASASNASKAENSTPKSLGKGLQAAIDEVNYNSAKAAMTDADAAKLKSMIKSESNEAKKAELQQLLRRQVQQRLQSKR